MTHQTEKQTENGAALIVVLCLLVLCALLTASTVTISQISNESASVCADRGLSTYLAEGAAARIQWSLIADRMKNPNRNVENTDYDLGENERFLADGSRREMNLYGSYIEYYIMDMNSGINISGANPSSQLAFISNLFAADPDSNENFLAFLDKVKDYTDRDSLLNQNGFEEVDYNGIELPNLPRNNRMQYREEILWVPGAEDFFCPDKFGRLSVFQVIPPTGLKNIRGKSNFFAADDEFVRMKCSLNETEMANLIEAKQKWQNELTPITETLQPDLLAKIKQQFTFSESGYYTLIIKASPASGKAGRTLVVSFKIHTKIPNYGNRYYEYQSF
jgi:hypothetical protein